MLQGSIANIGNEYVVVLKVTNCATGDSLAAEQVRGESKEQVLAGAGQSRLQPACQAGRVCGFDREVRHAPSSRRALPRWRPCRPIARVSRHGRTRRATRLQFRFISAPSNWIRTSPWHTRGWGRSMPTSAPKTSAIENSNKAFSLHDRVSERERFYIDAAPLLSILSPGKREKTVRVLRAMEAEAYPREAAPARTFDFVNIRGSGARYEDALREAARSSASGSRLSLSRPSRFGVQSHNAESPGRGAGCLQRR